MQPPYQAPIQVAPDIFMVQIPIPIPLKYVNCYLAKGASGWTLVDTGFHDELAEDAWPRAFADLGIRAQDIDQILITHYHPDHMGAAGWLQQLTGAPAYLHDVEFGQVDAFWGLEMDEQIKQLEDFYVAHGMPEEFARAVREQHHHQSGRVLPLAELTPLPTGSMFRIGADEYEVLWTPGHSDGLAIFWNQGSGLLFANDMILNKITPNVSLWANSRPNPLDDYIRSLVKVEALNARLALPGHRTVIESVSERCREIRLHHAERLDAMERPCGTMKGATAWEVCQQVFNTQTLTIHQLRFAMSETLAHLVYMEKQGRLLRKGARFVQAD